VEAVLEVAGGKAGLVADGSSPSSTLTALFAVGEAGLVVEVAIGEAPLPSTIKGATAVPTFEISSLLMSSTFTTVFSLTVSAWTDDVWVWAD
jgi:hypothetical protein